MIDPDWRYVVETSLNCSSQKKKGEFDQRRPSRPGRRTIYTWCCDCPAVGASKKGTKGDAVDGRINRTSRLSRPCGRDEESISYSEGIKNVRESFKDT